MLYGSTHFVVKLTAGSLTMTGTADFSLEAGRHTGNGKLILDAGRSRSRGRLRHGGGSAAMPVQTRVAATRSAGRFH